MYGSLVKVFSSGLCLVLLLASCAPGVEQKGPRIQSEAPSTSSASLQVGDQVTFDQVPYQMDGSGNLWIPLIPAAESFDFVHEWDEQAGTMKIGYRDVQYQVTMNGQQALVEEQSVPLPHAPKLIQGQPYISEASLEKLWGTEVNWNQNNHRILISEISDDAEEQQGAATRSLENGTATIQRSLKNVNEDALLRYAAKFKGVPYRFGASPYSRSKRFDCSSYTQHVYKKFGVNLPRTARAQAKRGYRVSIGNLQKGDMLFFFVPGRFNTNRTVGHVGIYAGNGRFIHTYGKPGVTTTSINASYWKNTFLYAKRVVQ